MGSISLPVAVAHCVTLMMNEPPTAESAVSSTKTKTCWPDVSARHCTDSEAWVVVVLRFEAAITGPLTLLQVSVCVGGAAGQLVETYRTALNPVAKLTVKE